MREQILNEASTIDALIVLRFLKKLTTPFEKMEAFKLGIIDASGNVLRKRKTLGKEKELEAFTLLDRVVINLKKILSKIPGGKSRLASYAAALWLLKEEKNLQEYLKDPELLYESFYDHMILVNEDKQKVKKFFEDGEGITNNVGSGNIAGTGHDGQDPLVPKKTQKKLQKQLLRRKTFNDFTEENDPDPSTD